MNNKISHRYSTTRIQLVDATGTPLSNKEVRFELKNHEFLFGSGAFDSIPLTSDIQNTQIAFYSDKPNFEKSFYQERMDKWTKLFNYGTIPFYWAGYEPTEGAPLMESRMNAAKYLTLHNAKVKGHPLCWHTECVNWLMEYDNKTILEKQLARINRDVTAFRGVVDMWDVINETLIMPVYNRYDNAITRICKEYGRINLIKEVFDAAHSANPDAVLLINDFNLSKDYQKLIDECLEAQVPISAIGIQSHQHQGYKGMAWLEEVLERFSVFGLPLHFTENTLLSGDIMPAHIVDLNDYQVNQWPSTPEGEERQAKEWKEMYVRLFEHQLVEAITGWDFADGGWLHAPSGILREDNSEKPVYHTLDNLIHNKWHTNETLVTDANGYVVLTGIRGNYQVTSSEMTTTFDLTKKTNEIRLTIV